MREIVGREEVTHPHDHHKNDFCDDHVNDLHDNPDVKPVEPGDAEDKTGDGPKEEERRRKRDSATTRPAARG